MADAGSHCHTLAHALALGLLAAALACGGGGDDEGDGEGDELCTPGELVDCECPDQTTSTKACNPSGVGYDACACDSETGSGGTETGDGDGDDDGVNQAPVVSILNPGDGEARPVDLAIPFAGDATDAEDGTLDGMSVVWTSDLDGQIGTGLVFEAPLTTVGVHTITMTATDSDNLQGSDQIQLDIQ